MSEEFRYLNNDIDISDFYDKLPRGLKALIAEAEQLDRDDNEGALLAVCEGIEIQGKLCVPDGITKEQWERLCDKYYIY